MPRQLTFRGSRLVFSRGIVSLAAIASFLIILFNACVTALIPLWAVGVFLSFTLSQLGMARHWWRAGVHKDEKLLEAGTQGWQWKLVVNGFGAICTALVTLIFVVTKFTDGAWIIVLLLPAIVVSFFSVHRHYQSIARDLSLDNLRGAATSRPPPSHHPSRGNPPWDVGSAGIRKLTV